MLTSSCFKICESGEEIIYEVYSSREVYSKLNNLGQRQYKKKKKLLHRDELDPGPLLSMRILLLDSVKQCQALYKASHLGK